MSKKPILVVSSLALLAGGAAIMSLSGSVRFDAASLQDSSTILVDEFASGIDAAKYTVIGDTAKAYDFVDKPGVLKLDALNYGGYVHTKEKIATPTGKSLVIQYDTIADEITGGYVCLWKNASALSEAWTATMPMWRGGGSFAGSPAGNNATGVATPWIGFGPFLTNSTYKFIFTPDGGFELHTGAVNGTLAKLWSAPAGTYTNNDVEGFAGFMGNAMIGSITIDNFKAGYCDSIATLDKTTWQFEDNFDTADKWEVLTPEGSASMGSAKYLVGSNAAHGSGIIYNTVYNLARDSQKVVSGSLDLDVTELETGKKIGLAGGIASDATSTDKGFFVGVGANEAGNTALYAINKGVEIKSVDLGKSYVGAKVTINLDTVAKNGVNTVTASVGTSSVEMNVDNIIGKAGIATLGETGKATAKILKLCLNSYYGVLENGKSLVNDFSKPLNHNWYVLSNDGTEANARECVFVKDGVLRFDRSSDGSYMGPNLKYVNFDLSFDAKKQQLEEDDDGNITKASTWLGMSMGRKTLDERFEDSSLLYIANDTADDLNMSKGERIWLPAKYQFPLISPTAMLHVHVTAVDGTVKFYMQAAGEAEETLLHTYKNIDTDGYFAFTGTAGADFTIDNLSITNLDGGEAVNAKPVAVDYAKSVAAGGSLTGKVVATDDDDPVLTYELVNDNTASKGTLTFNPDGTYTFDALKSVAGGTVNFTYKAFDTEDYSEVKTVTITITGFVDWILDTARDAEGCAEKYAAAKTRLLAEGKDGIAAFKAATDERGVAARARYENWAKANHDDKPYESVQAGALSVDGGNSSNLVIGLSIAGALMAAAGLTAIIAFKKKKRN